MPPATSANAASPASPASTLSDRTPNLHGPDPHGRRAARVLAVCQAVYTSSVSIDLTLTGLVGYTLADDKALATLPFSLITVAAALTTIFASFLMARIGRRAGFVLAPESNGSFQLAPAERLAGGEGAGSVSISSEGEGGRTEVATFEHTPFPAGFSGNTIKVCPVGALMSKPFRFKARPWELVKTP